VSSKRIQTDECNKEYYAEYEREINKDIETLKNNQSEITQYSK
jgi:hypothetical protein